MKYYDTTSNESLKADYIYILNKEETAKSASDEFISEMEDLLFRHSGKVDGKIIIEVYSEDDKTLWMDMMAASITSNIREVDPSARQILEDLTSSGDLTPRNIDKHTYYRKGASLLGSGIIRKRKYLGEDSERPYNIRFSWTMRKIRNGAYLELRLGSNKVIRFLDSCWEVPHGLESSAA